MDHNDIDLALHDIEQMVLIAFDVTQDDLIRSDVEPDCYRLSEANGERLAFAMNDLVARVEKLRAGLRGSDG
jgi:hypothetical protein